MTRTTQYCNILAFIFLNRFSVNNKSVFFSIDTLFILLNIFQESVISYGSLTEHRHYKSTKLTFGGKKTSKYDSTHQIRRK